MLVVALHLLSLSEISLPNFSLSLKVKAFLLYSLISVFNFNLLNKKFKEKFMILIVMELVSMCKLLDDSYPKLINFFFLIWVKFRLGLCSFWLIEFCKIFPIFLLIAIRFVLLDLMFVYLIDEYQFRYFDGFGLFVCFS